MHPTNNNTPVAQLQTELVGAGNDRHALFVSNPPTLVAWFPTSLNPFQSYIASIN
jgi:hypothetical protein